MVQPDFSFFPSFGPFSVDLGVRPTHSWTALVQISLRYACENVSNGMQWQTLQNFMNQLETYIHLDNGVSPASGYVPFSFFNNNDFSLFLSVFYRTWPLVNPAPAFVMVT